MKGPLAGFQDFEYVDPACRVGTWAAVLSNTLQEVLALDPEGLLLCNLYCLCRCTMRNGNPIDPVDTVRIKDKFPFRFHIVKYSHLLAPDNGQFLLFERVKPAHKYVNVDAAGKLTGAQRCVGNPSIDIGTTMAGDSRGHFFKQVQNR